MYLLLDRSSTFVNPSPANAFESELKYSWIQTRRLIVGAECMRLSISAYDDWNGLNAAKV